MADFQEVNIRLRYAELPTDTENAVAPFWHMRAELDGTQVFDSSSQDLGPLLGGLLEKVVQKVSPTEGHARILPNEEGIERAIEVQQ